jgi:hypothetical protein
LVGDFNSVVGDAGGLFLEGEEVFKKIIFVS